MAVNKICESFEMAVSGIKDGSTILVSGFGGAGMPTELLNALRKQGASDLTIVSNNAGVGKEGIGGLLLDGRVRKVICSYPRSGGSVVFEEMWAAGKVDLEVVPQGTLSERIRAAGAGIGGFYTPSGVGTRAARTASGLRSKLVVISGNSPKVFAARRSRIHEQYSSNPAQ